jgi:formamidopyrimidine-DNA glycosylase
MPEGPECKLLADNLHKKFKGTKLTNIEILAGRYKKHGPFRAVRILNADL